MQTTPGTPLTHDTTPPWRQPSGRARLWWFGVALAVYALDQGTKYWAEQSLSDGQPRQLLGDWLQLRLTHNAGAAFSTGTSYTMLLSIIALVVVVVCIRLSTKLVNRGWAVALGLLLGGALGNVTDRIFRPPSPLRGHVVDFLELPHWPIFNVADSAICVAAALFVVLNLLGMRLDGRADSEPATGSSDETAT